MDNLLLRLPLLAASALALLLAGCQEEEGIARRVVPAPEKPPQEVKVEVKAKVRLLAAIVPEKERSWFFKLLGPVDAVGEQQKAFEAFIQTVRLTGDAKEPIAWKLPDGWKQEAGKGMRYATIRLGRADAPLELSVSSASGSLKANIDRWRNLDLGLKPILEAQLPEVARPVKVGDVEVILIDMSGPGGKGGMGAPMMPPR